MSFGLDGDLRRRRQLRGGVAVSEMDVETGWVSPKEWGLWVAGVQFKITMYV